jgi:phosphoribosylformimino-5-aminoimidazole carboxamide ribotide isomerase
VAEGIHRAFGIREFYMADLDAIQFERPNWNVYRNLADAGFRLWIDAGVRDVRRSSELLKAGAHAIIVGLETCPNPEALAAVLAAGGQDRVVFSLDLKHGIPLGDTAAWGSHEPLEIVRRAVSVGTESLIVLDLAQVGARSGLSTSELCVQIKQEHASLRLITGGGVRGLVDLERLQTLGIDGVLVATALHDGSLTAADLAAVG